MKISITFTIVFLAIISVSTDSFSADKNKINLIKPPGTQKESLQKPDDSLKSFDVTAEKSRLDKVRVQESRQGNSIIDSTPHPSRHAYSKDPSDLDIDPKSLKGLLYPPQKEDIEEEELSSQTAKPTTAIATRDQDLEEEARTFALAHHNPMITDLGNGEFIVDEGFENQIPTLIDMNKLSYAIGKRGTIDGAYDDLIEALKRSLNDQGWEIKEFEGKSGKRNRTDDTPGFVAYNKEKNIMTVILRGSQTREDEEKSADWEVNFDSELIDFPGGGKIHRGFYNRSLSMMSHIQEAVDGFLSDLDDEKKSKVKVMVSGHSQGAAIASIIMPLLAEYFRASKTFGENFDNAKDNVLQGYFISTPRVYTDLTWINEAAGKHNMIRQNVTGSFLADPVPVASPGKTITALISLIPFYGEGLAEKYGGGVGTKSVGYLAADWSKDAMTRQLGSDTLSLIGRRAHAYFWNRWDIVKDTVTKPWHLLTLKTSKTIFTKLLFEPVKDGLSTLFAPLHYGVTSGKVEEGEALFGPGVVAGYTEKSPTMAELLAQGFDKKKSEREGLSGIVRSAVESAAKIKHGLPDLPTAVSGIASTVKEKVTTGLKSAFSGFKKKLFGLW